MALRGRKKNTIFIVVNLLIMFVVWVSSMMGLPIFSYLALGISWPFVSVCQGIDRQLKQFSSGYAVDREYLHSLEIERNHLLLQVSLLKERLTSSDSTDLSGSELIPSWTCLEVAPVINDEWFCDVDFVINAGAAQGIEVGNVFLINGVVAGKVIECKSNVSRVAIIQDYRCSLSVKVEGCDLVGIVNGGKGFLHDKGGGLPISYLPYSEDYEIGNRVVTSGLSPAVPGELPVGELMANENGQVIVSADRLFYRGCMNPFFKHRVGYGTKMYVVVKKR